MDWSNKEVLTNPNLSYTSRDYTSILEQLKSAIPLLTKNYNPQDDTDPGIVLIKVMSMLGDMLSFNTDNAALEAFPRTVLQLPNAQQIFRLVGYKMSWYRSARCEASFVNQNSVPVTIGIFNRFTSSHSSVTYTNMTQIEIPAGAAGNSMVKAELVQGTPVTPPISNSALPLYQTGEWHDAYTYNINASRDVVNNKLYLEDTNVDGSTIILIDDDSTSFATLEWQLVDNLNTLTDIGKFFEFDYDETGSPFIQFPDYWNTRYAITRFKLFYVKSDGADGEIIDNALNQIQQDKIYIAGSTSTSNYMDNLHIYNTASTYGYSPETADEARKNAELFINTIDTLVICEDFTKAVKRMEGVANALTTDRMTDPEGEYLLSDQLKIYVVRKPGYRSEYGDNTYGGTELSASEITANDQIWIETVVDALNKYKLSKYDISVYLENAIDWIDWTVEGSLWMRQPIPTDKNHDILVKINDNLDYTFSPSNINFNEAIHYIDVIDNIKSSDRMIYHVDLNTTAITYSRIRRNTNGNPTGLSVERKWRIFDKETGLYTHYYANGFGCVPTPGGDGTEANEGFRILREDGVTVSSSLELDTGYEVNEFEIYNNRIYVWVQAERRPTDYFVDITDPDNPFIYKLDPLTGAKTPTNYIFSEHLGIILADGFESGEYFKRNNRDIKTGNQLFVGDVIRNADISVQFTSAGGEYVINDDGSITVTFEATADNNKSHMCTLGINNAKDIIKYGAVYKYCDKIGGNDTKLAILTNVEGNNTLENLKTYDLDSAGAATFTLDDGYEIVGAHIYMSFSYGCDKERTITFMPEIIETPYNAKPVYDIWDSTFNEWTQRFVDRSSGEIFLVRNNKVYSTKRYYQSDSGLIVDSFGEPVLDEDGNYIRDAVSKEELTGRYEQYITPKSDNPEDTDYLVYDFFLGQDAKGNVLKDSINNDIVGFPIKPDGFHAFIDIDKYLLHDTGRGIITGTSGILNGPGSINYASGHVKFTLNQAASGPIKIVYYKNTVAMARYMQFDTDKFYTQPQFLKYTDATRSLG